jgi:hypothetical protein
VFIINDHPETLDLEIALEALPLAPPGPPSRRACPPPRGAARARPARVPGASAARAAAVRVEELLAATPGCSRETCFVRATAARAAPPRARGAAAAAGQQGGAAAAAAAAETAAAEAVVWLAPFKDMPLQDPGLTAWGFAPAEALGPGAVKFTVLAAAAAAPLALWEAPALRGRFSINALTLGACEAREVVFYPSASPEGPAGAGAGSGGGGMALVARLQEELRLSSLWEHQRLYSS